MAMVIADRIKEHFTTTGTGTITILGTLPGFKSFPSAMVNGDTTYYVAEDPMTGEYECGIGTYNSSTIARTTVTASSNGSNTAISWAAGTKYIWIDTTARYHSDLFATAANMEAAASTVFVSPSVQQRHPSSPKAWAYVTVSGTTPTVAANYNVSGSTYLSSTGSYRVSFTTSMSSTNYCVQVTCGHKGGTGNLTGNVNALNTGSVDLLFTVGSGTVSDPTSFHVVAFGDQ